MGVEEHEASTFSYYQLTKRSDIIVTDRFFCALFRKSCLPQRFAPSFRSMKIMMSAPCPQEVGRSARSYGNPRMDRFTSPGGYTCASTGRMHAVCDEHGSHSFKSDGLPAHRPWMYEVVFLHAHGVGSVHTACLVLLDPSRQTDDANLILRIANGPDRNYPR